MGSLNHTDTNTKMPAPYIKLDKNDCAFLWVDHQTGLCNLVQDFGPEAFRSNVNALIDVAKYFNKTAPSILTTSFESGPNGPLVSELKEAFPKAVKATGKKQMIVSGVLTEICVAFPVLSLIEQGYEVFVCTDASGTFNEPSREAAHKRMAQAGAQLLNWVAIAAELHRDWRNDIEGFGAIWGKHVPAYKLLIDSYAGAQANKQ